MRSVIIAALSAIAAMNSGAQTPAVGSTVSLPTVEDSSIVSPAAAAALGNAGPSDASLAHNGSVTPENRPTDKGTMHIPGLNHLWRLLFMCRGRCFDTDRGIATQPDLQRALDELYPGEFAATSQDSYDCVACKVKLTRGTGSLALCCLRHFESTGHNEVCKSLKNQPRIDSFYLPGPPATPRPRYCNVIQKRCTGYRSRCVKYVSKRYSTINIYNPFLLIHELMTPLPIVSLDDPMLIDLTEADLPTWLPFSRGAPGSWYPHFRSTKCRGAWIEESYSYYDLPTAYVHVLCEDCRSIVFEESFKKRLARAARKTAERGNDLSMHSKGQRKGPEIANHPTLKELVEGVPQIVQAFRESRRKLAYYQSKARTIRSKLRKYANGSAQVWRYSIASVVIMLNHAVISSLCATCIPCAQACLLALDNLAQSKNGLASGKATSITFIRDMLVNFNRKGHGARWSDLTKELLATLCTRGSPTALVLFSKQLGLASRRTIERYINTHRRDFKLGYDAEGFKFVEAFYKEYMSKHRIPFGSVLFTFAEDETAITGKIVWSARLRLMFGFCGVTHPPDGSVHECNCTGSTVDVSGLDAFARLKKQFEESTIARCKSS